jgi:DNA-directed RNA polymerase specialized sigma24 family protein
MDRPPFESYLDLINQEIAKRRSQWKLTSIAWMDFNDVEQKLRLHIFKKWEKWNPEMPLLPWLNTVITNQIINLVRNNYSNYARPCLNCPHNAGGNNCKLYGTQNNVCADYAKWEKTKKHAYDVKLPVSVNDERIFGEGNEFDARASESSCFDFELFVPKVHDAMLKSLSPIQQKVYAYLFIDGLPETEVITMLGYKNGSTKTGYKFVKKIRAQIVVKAKKIVKEMIR